jgi:hypothetical protein
VLVGCPALSPPAAAAVPGHLRRALDPIPEQGWRFGGDVAPFSRPPSPTPGKLLAFQGAAGACRGKGKVGKENECSRVCQVGRSGGNFLLVGAASSGRMADSTSLGPMITAPQPRYGAGVWRSGGTNQGAYRAATRKSLRALPGQAEVGLPHPGLALPTLSERERASRRRLANRRAGSEPLLGPAPQGGHRGHRPIKADATTLAAGYAAMGGFNLRPLSRPQRGKKINPLT